MQPIGILGGTFDPIHLGHLRTAVELREVLQLQEVRLVPCGQPPHRAGPIASAAQRTRMVRMAIEHEPGLVLDERELKRAGPSYTIDTLLSFKAEFPQTPLCLILGADQFVNLDTWHRWRELPELAHLIVVYRPGWNLDGQLGHPELARLVQEHLTPDVAPFRERQAGRLFFAQVSSMDIASSRIRRALAEDKNVRYLVPEAVLNFIRDQNLYRNLTGSSNKQQAVE